MPSFTPGAALTSCRRPTITRTRRFLARREDADTEDRAMSGEYIVTDFFNKGREFKSQAEALQRVEHDALLWASILRERRELGTERFGPLLNNVSKVAELIWRKCSEYRIHFALDVSSPDVWYKLPESLQSDTDQLFLALTDATPRGFIWLDQGEGATLRLAIERGGLVAGEACLKAMLADPDAHETLDQNSAEVGTSLGTVWVAMRDYWQPELEARFSDRALEAQSAYRDLRHALKKAEGARQQIEETAATWRSTLQSQVEEADRRSKKRSEDLESSMAEGERKLESILEKYEHQAAIEGPSKRWKRRADELKIQERSLMAGIYVVTVAGMTYLGFLLNQWITESPWMPMSVGSFKGIAIFLAILAGWGFLLRTLARLTFSTIHLRRDAEERLALSQYYISLLETDKEIGDQARHVVLSALFTRSQSGLLQTESDPNVGFDSLLSRFRS